MALFFYFPQQRDSLTKKVDRLHRKQEAAISNNNHQLAQELGEQLDNLRSNIAFVQDNINECQSNIMSMEETKVTLNIILIIVSDDDSVWW